MHASFWLGSKTKSARPARWTAFGERGPGQGAFWWRKPLAMRAGVQYDIQAGKYRTPSAFAAAQEYDEQSCPGHVASIDNPKICGRCGVHIDSLRPDDEDERGGAA